MLGGAVGLVWMVRERRLCQIGAAPSGTVGGSITLLLIEFQRGINPERGTLARVCSRSIRRPGLSHRCSVTPRNLITPAPELRAARPLLGVLRCPALHPETALACSLTGPVEFFLRCPAGGTAVIQSM